MMLMIILHDDELLDIFLNSISTNNSLIPLPSRQQQQLPGSTGLLASVSDSPLSEGDPSSHRYVTCTQTRPRKVRLLLRRLRVRRPASGDSLTEHLAENNGVIVVATSNELSSNFVDGLERGRTKNVIESDSSPSNPFSFAHLRGTNILVNNVNARVFTNQMWTGGRRTKTNPKTSPELSAIFQLFHDDKAKNVTSIFHDDWAKNVTSRVHAIQLTGTIFELNSHIKETNVLTEFRENWAKNVTSRVFTCFHYLHIEKNGPPTGGHVFSPIWTIFELVRDINKTNVLTNFHDDWAKIVTSRVFTRKTAPPTGGNVFQRTGTTFELNQHIIKTNILTNFELDRDFIGKKLLTKYYEDRTINVASRVLTNKCGRTDGRTTDKDRSQKLT
ncbi:hypothetical protein DPMN_083078 [Dreissena polymorpha]|uniref:Uncharacterized protein n=1 Tax=Dreissena polymorpha TaxID=45954 RepID=A0A9D4BHD3_DREPO|nr:hypothetical protein DPMN_083078 [Dreissena polymorpha]